MFMTGEDIYHNFNKAPGSQPLAEAARMVQQLVGQYEQQADEIIELTKAMESAWQGDAAGAAQRGAGPLVIAHALAAPQINVAQDLSARQVGSFGDAKNSVVPVPAKPTAPDPWPILSPNPMATYADQVAKYNAAVQQNVDVMSSYSHSSMYNTVGLPSSYGSLADDSADVSIDTPDDGAVGPRSPGVPDGDGGPRDSDRVRPGEPVPGLVEPRPAPTEPGGVPPRQVTDPSGFRPPGSGPVPVPPGVGGPGGSELGVGPVAGPGSVAGLSGGRGGWSGGERLAGRGGMAGGAGFVDGERLAGRGGLTGGGVPGGGSPNGERPAGRGGLPGGLVGGDGEGGRARGGPSGVVPVDGARGRGGVPMGGVGAGRGRGGDDEEHERASFLQGPDPEATFGSDERTAPSVIE